MLQSALNPSGDKSTYQGSISWMVSGEGAWGLIDPGSGEMGGSEEYDLKAIVQDTLNRLNEVIAEQLPKGMRVETIVRHGSIYAQILEAADEIKADLIVVGANRPQLADNLLGPITARVVRHAKCSVNVVRLQ